MSAPATSMPAIFQSASSAACVPDLSPREIKSTPLSLTALSAAAMSFGPLTPAGSLLGPTRMKSLYMTACRFSPKPPATNFSSWGLAWTNTTSQSPRRPVSSACPVPCERTFTSIPVLALNSGKICPNNPESWVDVVEETTIDFSCADANGASRCCEGNRERKQRSTCPCKIAHCIAVSFISFITKTKKEKLKPSSHTQDSLRAESSLTTPPAPAPARRRSRP